MRKGTHLGVEVKQINFIEVRVNLLQHFKLANLFLVLLLRFLLLTLMVLTLIGVNGRGKNYIINQDNILQQLKTVKAPLLLTQTPKVFLGTLLIFLGQEILTINFI